MRSTRFQIQAFAREFPALFRGDKPLIDASRVQEVRVSHVTRELLEVHPSSWEAAHREGDHEDDGVWLLGADLSPIGKVRSSRTYGTDVTADGETVGEAIARLGCADRVAAILRRWTGYGARYEAVLYRAPKGWSIPEWVSEQQRRAAALLAAEVAAIDDGPLLAAAERGAEAREGRRQGPV